MMKKYNLFFATFVALSLMASSSAFAETPPHQNKDKTSHTSAKVSQQKTVKKSAVNAPVKKVVTQKNQVSKSTKTNIKQNAQKQGTAKQSIAKKTTAPQKSAKQITSKPTLAKKQATAQHATTAKNTKKKIVKQKQVSAS